MTEIGYIASISGEEASVIFKRKSGCGDNCASCKSSCSAGAFRAEVKNTLNAKVGDRVKVSMEEKVLNKMIALVYVFPLIMLFVGIGVGINVFKNLQYANYEFLSFLLGMALLAVSYAVLSVVSKNTVKKKQVILRMVEVINE